MLPEKRRAPVLTCSSYTGVGLDEVWDTVTRHRAALEADGDLVARRLAQQRDWLWNMVREEVLESLRTAPGVRRVAADVESRVAAEAISALEGSAEILAAYAAAVPTLPWAGRPKHPVAVDNA